MNVFIRILILVVGGLSLLACNKSVSPNNTVDPYSTAGAQQAVVLTRVTQRVISYNCQGQVIRDVWQTVSPAKEWVSVPPKNGRYFYQLDVVNTTNSTRHAFHDTSFYIGSDPSPDSITVVPGVNRLDYQLSFCPRNQQNRHGELIGPCQRQPQIEEAGTLYVNVAFSEQRLPDPIIHRPSALECDRARIK